jgi:hypothetical protein
MLVLRSSPQRPLPLRADFEGCFMWRAREGFEPPTRRGSGWRSGPGTGDECSFRATARTGRSGGVAQAAVKACLPIWGEERVAAAVVLACPWTFIGQLLDTNLLSQPNSLISLALPRGLEPLFSP